MGKVSKQTVNQVVSGYLELQTSRGVMPLKFGVNAMALIEDLSQGQRISSFSFLRTITWAAMLCGAEYKGKEFDLNIIQVGDLLDELGFDEQQKILTAFENSMPKKQTEPDEKKN